MRYDREAAQRRPGQAGCLVRAIGDSRRAWEAMGRPDAPVTIDADVRVPWREVTNVVDLAKRAEAQKIEFAMGRAPTARSVR